MILVTFVKIPIEILNSILIRISEIVPILFTKIIFSQIGDRLEDHNEINFNLVK